MTRKASKSRATPRVHVISRKDGWAVKREGLSKASRIYDSKPAAVTGARNLQIRGKRGHDVVVHKRDGSIQKWEKSKR